MWRPLYALALCACLTSPALAQDAPEAPSEAQLTRAKALYDASSRYYDLGEYQKALDGFQESYLLSGAPALLLNIGQCYRFLERYDEAKRSYESYLRVEPESELRAEVESLITQMQDLLAQKQVSTQTSTQLFAPAPFSFGAALGLPPEQAARLEERQTSLLYYAAGGASAGIGLIVGGVALAAALEAQTAFDEQRELASREAFRRARIAGVACDVLLVGGGVLGVLGWRAAKQEKAAKQARAVLGPSSMSLVLEW